MLITMQRNDDYFEENNRLTRSHSAIHVVTTDGLALNIIKDGRSEFCRETSHRSNSADFLEIGKTIYRTTALSDFRIPFVTE